MVFAFSDQRGKHVLGVVAVCFPTKAVSWQLFSHSSRLIAIDRVIREVTFWRGVAEKWSSEKVGWELDFTRKFSGLHSDFKEI